MGTFWGATQVFAKNLIYNFGILFSYPLSETLHMSPKITKMPHFILRLKYRFYNILLIVFLYLIYKIECT